MDVKRKDLKKLAKEELVDVDPNLIDDLMDESVEKYLDDYEKKVKQNEQTAAILTTVGTVTEKFGMRGTAQLAADISKDPPILGNVTSHITDLLVFTTFGACGLFAYKYFRSADKEE